MRGRPKKKRGAAHRSNVYQRRGSSRCRGPKVSTRLTKSRAAKRGGGEKQKRATEKVDRSLTNLRAMCRVFAKKAGVKTRKCQKRGEKYSSRPGARKRFHPAARTKEKIEISLTEEFREKRPRKKDGKANGGDTKRHKGARFHHGLQFGGRGVVDVGKRESAAFAQPMGGANHRRVKRKPHRCGENGAERGERGPR